MGQEQRAGCWGAALEALPRSGSTVLAYCLPPGAVSLALCSAPHSQTWLIPGLPAVGGSQRPQNSQGPSGAGTGRSLPDMSLPCAQLSGRSCRSGR